MKRFLFLSIPLLLSSLFSQAQVPQDLTFDVRASFNTSPFGIVLKWDSIPGATSIIVYRKLLNVSNWTSVATLAATDTVITDNAVTAGTGYEYQVKANGTLVKYAYIYVGKNLPAVHSRGKMILLVDSAYINTLQAEIDRQVKDLIGDGWQVIRKDISRSSPVSYVKNLIKTIYNSDPTNVKSLFLLGHIPVPYSGDLNPDGHPDHKGAWPADVFYADMTGVYNDVSINDTVAGRPENRNIPGDGKYDPSAITGTIALQTGRVDLFNMPAFTTNDTLLIKKYLDKDHAYRMKTINPRRQALVDDNFGYFSGEAFASSGWRNFYALLGKDSTVADDYFTGMKSQSYLWSYGCGGGTFTSCGGVGSTSNFVTDTLKNVFTMLFGSYFGDWDSQNNFLRAPLASAGWTLTNCWSGRPYWVFDHMGLGETIGYSTRISQNNSGTYAFNYGARFVHNALMGDPGLRMHIVAPPENLVLAHINNGSSAQLNWTASADAAGYYIYRADSLFGAFTLLTPASISSTTYTDLHPANGQKYYMVRAVKLENSNTGSYFNLSEGIMDTITISNADASLHEYMASSPDIYPNPASEQITIDFKTTTPEQGIMLSIYSLQGKLLLFQNLTQLKSQVNVSSLAKGMYIIHLENASGIETRKLVKE